RPPDAAQGHGGQGHQPGHRPDGDVHRGRPGAVRRRPDHRPRPERVPRHRRSEPGSRARPHRVVTVGPGGPGGVPRKALRPRCAPAVSSGRAVSPRRPRRPAEPRPGTELPRRSQHRPADRPAGRRGAGAADPGDRPGRRVADRRPGRGRLARGGGAGPGARPAPPAGAGRGGGRPAGGARRPRRCPERRLRRPARRRWAMVSNLPYNVATPLVARLLDEVPRLAVLSVMVQKEVAERLAAPPGSRASGAISVKVAYHATAAVVGAVPSTVFLPRPKVDSAVVRFVRRTAPPVDVPSPGALFALARAGFAQRRKTLRQALRPALGDR